MSLSVAVQMDPIGSINPAGDSTFAMMLEAQARVEMRQINELFKGLLPQAMVARPHHRFAS